MGFNSMSGVYALVDPRTDRVMYVGQSCDIDYRYRTHCARRHDERNRKKVAWITELEENGLAPRLVVLSECGYPEIDERERQAIAAYRAVGQCELNIAKGGAGAAVPRMATHHIDDWREFGAEIRRTRNALHSLAIQAGAMAGARDCDAILKAVKIVDRWKWSIEERAARLFPNQSIAGWFSGPDDDD